MIHMMSAASGCGCPGTPRTRAHLAAHPPAVTRVTGGRCQGGVGVRRLLGLPPPPTGRSRKVERESSFYFLLPGPPDSFYFLISFYFLLTRPSDFWQGSGCPRLFIFTSKYAYPLLSNNLSTFYHLSTFHCQDPRFRWRPEGINGFFFLLFNLSTFRERPVRNAGTAVAHICATCIDVRCLA